ncbi:MAG: acyltransferase [Gemmatimonadetes bacterium]|nr:acyltransferase [Gemmatimonadota bacterium]
MAFLPLRPVPLEASTQALYDEWLDSLEASLAQPDCNRYALCRRVLGDIYYPHLADVDPRRLPLGARVALSQIDAANVTLEPEYYGEIDLERYDRVKPLIWLWEMFDRSPLGENVHLGVRLRRILAKRIFRSCGRNFKAFHHVKLSFGYNLEVGDNVVVHRHVLLDDRGGIRIGNGVSISDFANVYSHSHDIVDGRNVNTPRTVIEDGVRLTYHATVLAGTRVAEDSMVGAMAMATKDTVPHTVHVGIPARPVKEKSAGERAKKRPPTPDPLGDPLEEGETGRSAP